MRIRELFGIDGFGLLIHATVTGIVLFWITQTNTSRDALVLNSAAGIASLVVLSVRRHLALRRMAPPGLTTGEVAAERLAELEGRMADLEAAQARIVELEERLDFAERLLARPPETRALPEGAER